MRLQIQTLDSDYSICRLPPVADAPMRPEATEFWSLSTTAEEISVVCETRLAPEGVMVDSGWKVFRVAGAMDLDEVGVLCRLLEPLRQAGISIFAISTFDTDYVLVRAEKFEEAVRCVEQVLLSS